MRVKLLVLLLAVSGVLPVTRAQVTCSPKVDKEMCAGAAAILGIVVDHGTYRGVGIPTEIVTPGEYAKQLADVRALEEREQAFLPTENGNVVEKGSEFKGAIFPDKFSPWHRHTFASNASDTESSFVTFFRDTPDSRFVSRILISSVAFEGTDEIKVGDTFSLTASVRPTGSFDGRNLFWVAHFIGGYLAGTLAQQDDSKGVTALSRLDDDGEFAMQSGKNASDRFVSLSGYLAYDASTAQVCWTDEKVVGKYVITAFTERKPETVPVCKTLVGHSPNTAK